VTATSDTVASWGGLILGLALAAALVVSWRVPEPDQTLGADLRMVAAPGGELELEPDSVFLSGRSLGAGDRADGHLRIRNLTGRPVGVRLRGLPSSHDLDERVSAELRSGDRILARGSLGELRAWTRTPLALGPGETREIEARLSVPQHGGSGYRGRIVDVTLEFWTRVTEERS
jgi:hypothetical protein